MHPSQHDPDQDRHRPHDATLTTKIIVWGGVALGVAGATAAGLVAARKIADMLGGEPPRRPKATLAPRFAEMDEDAREEIRRRARAQARRDSRIDAKTRAEAARRRNPPRRDAAADLTRTATSLSGGLTGLTDSVIHAVNGFRSVAAQAGAIIAEFSTAAGLLRELMGREQQPQPPEPRAGKPQPEDPRMHRL